jgi:hypothetical protein
MQNHKTIAFLAGILLLFAFHCATSHAPNDWLDQPNDVPKSCYGGWIETELINSKSVMGELIAISKDSMFIADSVFRSIPLSQIIRAKLIFYDSNYSQMVTWTFLGTLSTLSHGIGLIITAPLWLLVGSTITSERSWEPVIQYPNDTWENISFYARFPQGLPSSVDRKRITMKAPLQSNLYR